jgi:hypothetical protein
MNVILLSLAISAGDTGQLPPPKPLAAPQPLSVVAPMPVPPLPPISVQQFAANFVPVPGIHDVKFIQPYSKKPVDVMFRLPDGPLFKTYYSKNRITFDYGRTKVELIFRLIGGKVDVRYD